MRLTACRPLKQTIFVLYYHYYHCYYVLYGRPDSPSVRTLRYRFSLYSASARCDMKHILYRTQNCSMPLCVLVCVRACVSWWNQASDKMSTGSTDWLFVLRPASTMTTIDIITAIYSFPAYSTSSAGRTTMKTSFVLSLIHSNKTGERVVLSWRSSHSPRRSEKNKKVNPIFVASEPMMVLIVE